MLDGSHKPAASGRGLLGELSFQIMSPDVGTRIGDEDGDLVAVCAWIATLAGGDLPWLSDNVSGCRRWAGDVRDLKYCTVCRNLAAHAKLTGALGTGVSTWYELPLA